MSGITKAQLSLTIPAPRKQTLLFTISGSDTEAVIVSARDINSLARQSNHLSRSFRHLRAFAWVTQAKLPKFAILTPSVNLPFICVILLQSKK